MYKVTKHFGHDMGLSCCFRQPLAKSHCSKLHGYSLAFTVVLVADELDENNWVFDFGGFKDFREWLKQTFDHKTVIAENDPHKLTFRALHETGVIDLVELQKVGCEAFAKIAHEMMAMDIYRLEEVMDGGNLRNLRVESVTVHEHGGNSATYFEREDDGYVVCSDPKIDFQTGAKI